MRYPCSLINLVAVNVIANTCNPTSQTGIFSFLRNNALYKV